MWDWFIDFTTQLLAWIANFVGDWGLAVILLTFAVRLILSPLMINSTKSSAKMQALQPRLREIQERYADDPQRQQEEIRLFYSQNKFNPLGGCLPVFLQMPIFFALFTVIQRIPADAHFYGILPSLATSVSGAIAENGVVGAIVFILLDVLFGVLTLVPMLLNTTNADPAQAQQTKIMGVVMAVMMMWFGWSVPIGVVLYYDTSAAWGAIQQIFVTRRVMEKVKAEEEERLANMPVEVNVVRKEKKERPKKKK